MGFPFGGDSGGRSRKNTRKRGWFFAFGLALTGASFLLIFYLNLRFFKEPRMAGAPRESYGKPRFEWLNLAARAMADVSAGFSRAQLGG